MVEMPTIVKHRTVILHVYIAALLVALSVNPAFSQERKVNIAYAGPSLIALPFLAAQEWKLFTQNGLTTHFIAMIFTFPFPPYPQSKSSIWEEWDRPRSAQP